MIAVDLFAGAGGWSEGAKLAGVHVAAAVNHWPLAVRSHARNHPATAHSCQDVSLMDPTTLPLHDLLLASPACQGHADARGVERAHHDASRSTALAVVDVVQVTRPRMLVVENVPEFATKWKLYPHWCAMLQTLGYSLTENILDSSEFGVGQERQRLFVVGTLLGSAPTIRSPKLSPVPASSFLDMRPGKNWSPIVGHADATIARIANGRKAFGKQFLAPYYGSGSGLTGRSLDRPVGTVTTRDRWAVVSGSKMRMMSVAEYKAAMGFHPGYVLEGTRGEQIFQLGNAVCPPVAAEVVRQLLEWHGENSWRFEKASKRIIARGRAS